MRALVATVLAWSVATANAAQPVFPDAPTDEPLVFPRDHGAHPDFRTEWWYVTGWLKTADGADVGFQVTFFRSRLAIDDANPSRFAPRQMLFAHAALSDARTGRLLHDERIAREGFGLAGAAIGDADVVLDRWRFERVKTDDPPSADPRPDALRFRTRVDGDGFALDLAMAAHDGVLAQGADAARPGFSQKGPSPRDASRYYSVPQLAVSGSIVRDGRRVAVTGTAWLDREWSSAYLDPRAGGWDWVGLNLDDGGALMAFRIRDKSGAKLWAGGARRDARGRVDRYGPDDVDFSTLKTWTSPRSKTTWPVAQRIDIGGANPFAIVVEPTMPDQELDSRGSTGTIYWEGAVRVHADAAEGPTIGRGYLELTGYFAPLKF